MGVSTNAILCYGISFPDDYEFPWDDGGDSGYDIEKWWLSVNGYEPPFELFTASGDYIDGTEPPKEKVSEYFAHRRAFLAEHPLPVKSVMHCHGDYPMWILAAPSSVTTAYRGYPEVINPPLAVSVEEVNALEEFCDRWELEGDGPDWWLCSLWF